MASAVDRIMSRIDGLGESLRVRIDEVDARQTARMDRIEGRLRQHQDAAFMRETEVSRQLQDTREYFDKGVQEIRGEVEALKQHQDTAVVEGAAAGAARGVTEATVAPEMVNQTLKRAAKSPLGVVVLIAGGMTTIVTAATALPKVYRFFADFLPALGYYLGGGVG